MPAVFSPTRPSRSGRTTTLGPAAVVVRPPARGTWARRWLTFCFWSGLLAGVWTWWAGTPQGTVDGTGSALVEAGRATGMMAGYFLLVQILLMTRVGWLDRRLSANDLLRLHRDLGAMLTVLVLAHASLLIVGSAKFDGSSLFAETKTIVTGYPDMISALVATAILVGVALLAIRAIRTAMPYEFWYYLHMTSYLVLLLGYGHQFAAGRDLSQPGLARSFWAALTLLVVGCLIWGRVIAPIRLNLRHRLKVAEITHEGTDMFSVYIRGRDLHALQARAGQFFRWRFLTADGWWQAHPFSLSAAPNGKWLRLTIKAVGEYTEQLKWIDPGTRVLVEGPSGVFTADRRIRHRALLIAGGSGIAPVRALLEDLPRGTIVMYRASSAEDLIFREELDFLADQRDIEIFYVVGSRTDPGPRDVMTPKGLRRLVPDISRRDVYLCGPPGLMEAAVDILHRLRVPKRQIHLDPF